MPISPMIGLISFVLLLGVSAAPIPDEDWGYVPIRNSGQMFWWLYGMTDTQKRQDAPLVIWLQGGPGASGTGFGNFMEIGPLDVNLKPRPINWVQAANILFIDNPVGTGYSYVWDQAKGFATTDKQIGLDLVTLISGFYDKYPNLRTNPLWIFCESYGGKMATSFAVEILNAKLNANFKGVALGDSWIDPMAFVSEWGPYLYATSEVDEIGLASIQTMSDKTEAAVRSLQWDLATQLWDETENAVEAASAGVNFYNILDRSGGDDLHKSMRKFRFNADPLTALMNGQIKQKLKIIPSNVTWGGQSDQVFTSLSKAFMQPIVAGVDTLLKRDVQVVIYSGNLDLICCTTGTLKWMKHLEWPDRHNFWHQPRNTITLGPNQIVVGFSKTYKNLQLWNILSAGHMVPADQPGAAQLMLKTVINMTKLEE